MRSAKFGRGLRVFLVLETGEKAIFMVMGTPELAERVRAVLGA
jgi:hypothetical protein